MPEPRATITVNGEPRPLAERDLRALLVALGYDPARPGFAVALNREVVPRGRWEAQPLSAGDEVEVIGASQGG